MARKMKRLARESDGATYDRIKPAQKARIDACAWIYLSTKGDRIKEAAKERGVSSIDMARMYVWGAIKAHKRRGTGRTIDGILELIELEQEHDTNRAVPSDTSREVSRIDAINGTDYISIRGGQRVQVGTPSDNTNTKRPRVDLFRIYRQYIDSRETYSDAYTVEYDFMANNAGTMAAHIIANLRNGKAGVKKTIARILALTAEQAANVTSAREGELAALRAAIARNITLNIPTADIVELVRRYA